jgi:hypothetical protein
MKGKLYIVPKPEPPRPGCGTSLLANLIFELQWLAKEKAKGSATDARLDNH